MNDYVQKAYCFDKSVRIYAAFATNLVEKAREIHGLWPTASQALGRTLIISAIMSCFYKADEHLTIQIDGNGPLGKIIVEACNGNVRGFLEYPEVFLTDNKTGRVNVSAGVGKNGYLTVTKDLHMRTPFSSTSELVSGEIAEDFTYYFAKSEQIPSSVGVGVIIDTDNSIIAAGGFILQIMPGCKESTISKIEEILKNMKPCSQMINEGYTPLMMIEEITKGDFYLLEATEISYKCPCSRERFENGIKSIGKEELQKIIEEDKKAEVICHFCRKKYSFSEDDLKKLLNN